MFLDHSARCLGGDLRHCILSPIKESQWEYEKVIELPLRVGKLADHPSRKLMSIDYTGSALTLIACTLILLPLIWVITLVVFALIR